MKKLKSVMALASLAILASMLFTACPGPDGPNSTPVNPENTEEDKDAIVLDASKIQDNFAYYIVPLTNFVGKKVTIDFSCDIKVINKGTKDANLMWQLTADGYPQIASHNFKVSDKAYVKVSGKNTDPIEITDKVVLYLSTYQLDTENITIYLKNLNYDIKVSDASETPPEPEEPGKEVTKNITKEDLEALSPSGWAYTTYSLADFAGKKVKIDFSCEMKVENPDGNVFPADAAAGYKLMWQINSNGYPVVADHVFTADETDYVSVTGSKEDLEIGSGNVLYLSTNNDKNAPNLKVYVRNIKYTVTYVTSGTVEPEPEPINYPTDIFTVGEAGSCGLTIRGGEKKPFVIYTDGSAAAEIKTEADGSVSWISTAAGGAGGGVAFYIGSNDEDINIANYSSIDVEFIYSPITGAWSPKAKNPGFCMRILPWCSTGIFGGAEDLEYFDTDKAYGTYTYNIKISDAFAEQVKASGVGIDSVIGFALKFNDYQRDNNDGDQLKVQLKNVKFNAKENAPADVPFNDGLTEEKRGTVQEINYLTKDYAEYNAKQSAIATATEKLAKAETDEDKTKAQEELDKANAIELSDAYTKGYNKHAWVYLPAGYDPADTTTKYPVFILLHGFQQNENTWGLSNKGRGGKVKAYLDQGVAKNEVEKFILVCATGVASKNWGPNGDGTDQAGFNAFGGELRNDLIPYIKEKFNAAEGRDNYAIAGLSMGGGQTFNIGIGECLDMFSNFAGFSGALFNEADDFIKAVDAKFAADLKIHNLYMICGDADWMVYGSFPKYVKAMSEWTSRVENFESYTFPGGTHDFPVWYYGFNDFIHMVFKTGVQLYD